MHRRTFLTASAGAVAGFAGCQGGGGSGGNGGGEGQSLATHPAARALDAQPTLGPDPADATGVVVAFEDPSCPRCRAFERQVVPKIRSNLVDPGKAAFVFRGYPVVYDWGDPATRALEATYARDTDAFWSLVSHYFEQQDEFRAAGPDDVYPRTRTYLAGETDLDADAVVAAAQSDAAGDAVRTDLDAGKAAGAGRTTPHVFLFRDGQYLTKAAGSTSYETIASALQL